MRTTDRQPAARRPGDLFAWTPRGRRLLVSCGALVLVGFGALLSWPRPGEPAWMRVLGGGVLALGFTGVATLVVRARTAAPAPHVTSFRGTAATAVLREPRDFASGMAALSVFALTWAVGAVMALTSDHVVLGVLFAAIAVWSGGPAVAALAGRYTSGGLWLTSDGIVHRSLGLETSCRWDDLVLVVDDEPRGHVAAQVREGAPPLHTYRAGPWRGERVAAPDVAVVRTTRMALGPRELAAVLNHYQRTGAQRSELGTPRSLDTIARLADLSR